MPDIFDEVEEDLRAERARALGRRYWGAVAAAAILILAGTAAYVLWQQARTQAANAVADRFITAARQADRASGSLETGKPDADTAAAEKTFADIAAHGPAGYSVLARLRLAALLWQTGRHAEAVAAWQAVSDDSAAPNLLRDLATVTSAQHQVDTADPRLLKQRLEALTAPGNQFAPIAEQLIALLDLRTGRTHEAADIMRNLAAGPLVPEDIRSMASDLLSTLPPEAAPLAQAPAKPAPHAPIPPPLRRDDQPHG